MQQNIRPVRRTLGLLFALAAGAAPFVPDSLIPVAGAQERGVLQARPETPSNAELSRSMTLLEEMSRGFHAITEVIKPSVVKILARHESPLPDDLMHRSLRDRIGSEINIGSGVVLDTDGYIVTSNHVVDDATSVQVELSDGRKYDARVIGTDPGTDLAVLKVSADRLHPAQFADSDAVEVGHIVLAVGSPFRLEQSVSHGIVSAKGRKDVQVNIDYQDFIQTDAPINPGNSGGPLVNTRGQVIGINTAIATESGTSSGVGFATPSNRVRRIVDVLKSGGRVVRGYLGVQIRDVGDDFREQLRLADARGAIVTNVLEDGPAHKGGLKKMDVVRGFDGRGITNTAELRDLIAAALPGTSHELRVWRDGSETKLTVSMAEQPRGFVSRPVQAEREEEDDPSANGDENDAMDPLLEELRSPRKVYIDPVGIEVRAMTSRLARQYGLEGEAFDGGLLITDVTPESVGESAGLRVGQVILSIDNVRLRRIADLKGLLTDQKLDAGVNVRFFGRDGEKTVTLRVDD